MLENFEVFTTSGVVLFSKDLGGKGRPTGIINSLIRDVFIEERAGGAGISDAPAASNPPFRHEKYTLRWTGSKDLGLIFVAVYQSLVQLQWVDRLLDSLKTIFVELYGDQVRNPYVSNVECDTFSRYFDQQVRELEGNDANASLSTSAAELTPPSSSGDAADEPPPPVPGLLKAPVPKSLPTSVEVTPLVTPDTSRPGTPGSAVITGSSGPKLSRKAAKARNKSLATTSTPASSGDEGKARARAGKPVKKGRKWTEDGQVDESEDVVLDYSEAQSGEGAGPAVEAVNSSDVGTRTKKGDFILKDLDSEVHTILAEARAKKEQQQQQAGGSGLVGTGFSAISGLFRNVVGGKVLTKEDIEKPLAAMEKHLLEKNTAREAAVRICEGVERDLVGKKTGNFESIESTIKASVTSSLQKMLTPTTSLDLLRSIASVTKPSTNNPFSKPRPYVISVVGVNGVGKSTNLAKLGYFLLQNNLKLLIAACDTFRSGAVEQLRVHARNLAELSDREGRGSVELFERGYGKDAADIARQAIDYAAGKGADVVLIDTAGRQVSNQRLMGSLEKFGQLAKPDKILMVGEALVGSDSVAQARSFNASFGKGRGLDGFIISKCDTVGDMVGTLVSMVHATGIPVVFLGVGQHYGDLRTLNVDWAVGLLMS